MRIKLFVFCSILYFALLGAFIFHLNPATYAVSFLGFSEELPVVIWVLLPAVLGFIFALLHMCFYSFLSYLKYKNFFVDAKNLEHFASELVLCETPKTELKTKEFQKAGELMKGLRNNEKTPTLNEFNETLELAQDIENGENKDLRKYRLKPENTLLLKNEQNALAKDTQMAFARIKNKKALENSLEIFALEQVLEKGSLEQILALRIPLSKEQILSLFQRLEKENIKLGANEFDKLIQKDLSAEEFLSLAKSSVKIINPDSLLLLFEKLKNDFSQAFRAYLYVLAYFSMFDKLRLELVGKEKQNADFDLVLLARDHNKKFDLEKLIV